jgi:hypothetical protein
MTNSLWYYLKNVSINPIAVAKDHHIVPIGAGMAVSTTAQVKINFAIRI